MVLCFWLLLNAQLITASGMGAMDEWVLQIAMRWHWMLFIYVQSLEHSNIHSLLVSIEVPFDILHN